LDPVDLLKRMLEIYSPSGKEEKLAVFLRGELRSLGFNNVHSDEVGNVYGEVGNSSPVVFMCGHIDTVPGWIPVRVDDERIYGRGSVDAKSSLAAMVSAACELGHKNVEGKVIVAGVVDEELHSRGIRSLLRRKMMIDYAIFGEPGGAGSITFAYKGRLGTKIRCRTETGHVGAQHLYSNAVEEAYALWNQIRRAFESKKSPHGIFYSTTSCLTSMRSRRRMGSIPDECIFTIDARLPPTFEPAKSISLIRNVIEQYKRESPAVSVDLVVTDRIEPFVANRNTILMKALTRSIEEALQTPPKFIKKTGTGDMNIFGSETGVPVATYGPGDSGLSHTKNEYVKLEEFKTSIKVYEKTVEKTILEHHRPKSL